MTNKNLNITKRHGLIIIGIILSAIIILIIVKSNRNNFESLILESSNSTLNISNEIGDGDYDYTEANDHIGENATVTGTVMRIFTSKSGTVFLDFCENFQICPFSAVIFASDVPKFKDIDQYKREVRISGVIKSYQGRAEIIINGPEQIK